MLWKKAAKNRINVYDFKQEENKNITFLLSLNDNTFITELAAAVEKEAEKAGYTLKILDSKNCSELQIKQVESAKKNGEKAIIINIVDPNDAPNILKASGDMKVVFMSRQPADMSILNENAIHISSNQEDAGRYQGEWLAEYFNEKGETEIKYIALEGNSELTLTTARTNAALKALSENGINAVAAAPTVVADFEYKKALLNVFLLLLSGVQFDAVISNNDAMALGAIEALNDMKINPSEIPVVGIDATYQAFQAIQEGTLAMTVFQNESAQAKAAINAITNMLNGNPIDYGSPYSVLEDNPYVIYTPLKPVTIDNIPEELEYTVHANNIITKYCKHQ
jgi:ABC-type sugar transport system substrate-binding protein